MWCLTSAIFFLLLGLSSVNSSEFGKKLRTYSPEYKGRNVPCKSQMQFYQEAIENLEPWAVSLLDANAKIPSGILRANVDQFGDYDQCLAVRSPAANKKNFQGKYCLTEVEFSLRNNSSPNLQKLLMMAQADRLVTGNLTDLRYYIPATNIFLIGMCLPSACTEQDAADLMKQTLQTVTSESPFDVDIIIRHGLCRTQEPKTFSPEVIFAMIILIIPTALSIFCWASEASLKTKPDSLASILLLSMSLGRNWRLLWSRSTEPDPLGCIHGMRAFFFVLLYYMHKAAGYALTPLSNRAAGMDTMNQRWTVVIRIFWNYVDGLIYLTAVGTAFYAAKQLKNGKQLNIPKMYIKRYIRFVVPLLVVAYVVTYLTPLINDGPIWMRYFEHLTHNCQGKMWTLATFCSSFFGFPYNCYDTSNHLTTDLFLHLLAPFLVVAIWHRPSRSFNFLVLLGTLVAFYKYNVIQVHDAPPLSYNNFDRKILIKIANYLLFPPIMRLPIYLVGICMGCFLQHIDCKLKVDKRLIWLGNFLASLMAFYCIAWHYDIADADYVHHMDKTLLFALVHPYMWGCVLSWFIFICATGQAERLNKFCSQHGFVICTRLGLTFNLVQIPVMIYWVTANRSPITFSIFSLLNLHEILICVVLAIFFAVIYMAPIVQMWNIFNEGSQKVKNKTK